MGHKLRILGGLVLWSSVISSPNYNNLINIRKKALFQKIASNNYLGIFDKMTK
jgi:hypothetical protein